ncbi:VCBS domain-containing protein [Aeromonas dhakensis]
MKATRPDRDRHPDRVRRGQADEAQFVAGNGVASTGALGSLTITEGGAWTYNVDNSKVQYLGEGETKVETFVVEIRRWHHPYRHHHHHWRQRCRGDHRH